MIEGQFVDEAVSRRKFEREVTRYRELEGDYRRRGWFLVEAAFPIVLVIFASPKVTPRAIVCAVRLDFTNYDLVPPSVTFVDPFTGVAMPMKSLGFKMMRLDGMADAFPETITARVRLGRLPVPGTNTSTWSGRNSFPVFARRSGVSRSPGAAGDSWLLHRRSGEGSVRLLVEQIWASGINPIKSINYVVPVQVHGFIADPTTLPR